MKDKNATHDDIRRAYRRLSMKWHPDKNREDPSAEEKMKQMVEGKSPNEKS